MPTSVTQVGAPSTLTGGNSRNITDMNGQDFLKLLIAQLSNQDPLEPMKNKEILEQLSSIRSLEANMTLSENIRTLLNHQELSSATLLIGRTVTGLDQSGQLVEGKVERVILDASGIRLQVGDSQIPLRNVSRVGAEEVGNAP